MDSPLIPRLHRLKLTPNYSAVDKVEEDGSSLRREYYENEGDADMDVNMGMAGQGYHGARGYPPSPSSTDMRAALARVRSDTAPSAMMHDQSDPARQSPNHGETTATIIHVKAGRDGIPSRER